mgnify:CR=1 FL=1
MAAELKPATVLDVGQCSADHAMIKTFIERHFHARVEAVRSVPEALDAIRRGTYDLVLVNRICDDGSEGIELIRSAKKDELSTPIMLVSNYPDAQSAAVAAGAVQGFGKAELHQHQTLEHLAKFLPARPDSGL